MFLSLVVYAFMTRENMDWWSQRGVAHMKTTESLLDQPGTMLMRPACKARIPARTTGAGFIIKCFNFDETGRRGQVVFRHELLLGSRLVLGRHATLLK